MKTNDVKKGMKVVCTDGRVVRVRDNKRGISREVVVVMGGYPDIGAMYVWPWKSVYSEDGDKLGTIELTDKQKAQKMRINELGF